jgi:spore coat protein JC
MNLRKILDSTTEDMAAEQKARTTYEHLIEETCDPLVKDSLRFLWEREVVHFQRFGEMRSVCKGLCASISGLGRI